MSYPKLVNLAFKLARATAESRVTWSGTEQDDLFQVSFSEISVRIGVRRSKRDQNSQEYWLQIFNSEGDLVEEIGDEEVPDSNEALELYTALKETYETARRQAKGVDQVLNDILKELDDGIPY